MHESKIINIGRWLCCRASERKSKSNFGTSCTHQTTYLLAPWGDSKLGLPPRLCGPESRSWGTPPTRILVVWSLRLLGIFWNRLCVRKYWVCYHSASSWRDHHIVISRCSHCLNKSIEEHNFPLVLVLINKGRDVYWNAVAVWVSAIWRPPEHLYLYFYWTSEILWN